MTKEEKRKIFELLDAEIDLLMSKDLPDNHDLVIALAALLEVREYLPIREGLLSAAADKQLR